MHYRFIIHKSSIVANVKLENPVENSQGLVGKAVSCAGNAFKEVGRGHLLIIIDFACCDDVPVLEAKLLQNHTVLRGFDFLFVRQFKFAEARRQIEHIGNFLNKFPHSCTCVNSHYKICLLFASVVLDYNALEAFSI
jgi:hypothetical protein